MFNGMGLPGAAVTRRPRSEEDSRCPTSPKNPTSSRRNAPCVVIQGSDEKAKGEVTIKNLIIGAELAKLEKGREEHLQKQAEAQCAVPEAQLVEPSAPCCRAISSRRAETAAFRDRCAVTTGFQNKSRRFGFI